MISFIRSWLERRHRRAVVRRLADLDAQIAAAQARSETLGAYAHAFTNMGQLNELAEARGRIVRLQKIRAHNLQHQDTL